ncbi:homoserine dehydrogenase [Garciella nitratireducens]|uniref:homoserine dehydrogenase n=1 Tax=Garciella nitratireducens TaxID=218205 RepID=UPI000DE8F323|nr:homoserine dehydrogenase [Garciella nitratireducens]RBP43998.1 homoserine dehydrogenase [Garciella nitratireducens]
MKIGLLGLGTVGTGVFEIIQKRKEYLQKLYGQSLDIVKILVKDKSKKRQIEGVQDLLTTDPYDILKDPEIDLIIELIGGDQEAYEYMKYALQNGKHVVTANKAVVALHMKEFLALARKNKKAFLFEASVGGGIPLLKPLRQCSLLNDFYEIKGILNGTSNFILTKMAEEDLDFHEALKQAQHLGYAEIDPTDDIKGADVARKLAILASLAFHKDITLENIIYRGIRHIDKEDIYYLKDQGYSVKYFGKAITDREKVSAVVEPVLFQKISQFERVKDSFNMVSVKGDHLEELRFYGEGAGKNASANAVVCDVIDILIESYQRDFVVLEEQKPSTNGQLIEGKYFIRVNLKESSHSCHIFNLAYQNGISIKEICKLSSQRRILITEKTNVEKMQSFIQNLKNLQTSFFAARIEEE